MNPSLPFQFGRLPAYAIAAAILAFFLDDAFAADERPTLDASARTEIVTELSQLMEDVYVFSDVGTRCADELRGRDERGEFNHLSDGGDFASVLTRVLQEISKDKHVRVRISDPDKAEYWQDADEEALVRKQLERGRKKNFGFEQVLRLDGNVGVLDLRGFHDAKRGHDAAVGAMNFLSSSDALVVDLRQNGGGNPEMVQLISSYLFDEPTHLNSLYWREGDETQEFWTLEDVPGTRMPDVPVIVLTSRNTFSAAEEFTYNLQTRGRATIVGENTGGGAHPGGEKPLPHGLSVFISMGRAINPITGTNWEGTGIKPDVETDAESAFAEGLALAQKEAKAYREGRNATP